MQASLRLCCLQTPEDRFCHVEAQFCALFDIGKKKAFKTMMNYSAELQGLADIGKGHPLSLTARLACVSFVGL